MLYLGLYLVKRMETTVVGLDLVRMRNGPTAVIEGTTRGQGWERDINGGFSISRGKYRNSVYIVGR